MTIYLLVLADNLRVFAALSFVGYLSWTVFLIAAHSQDPEPDGFFAAVRKQLLLPIVLSSTILCLVPSSEKLRDAYILTEMSKVGTVENAKAFVERVEALIKLFAEKK